jgi:hypothetical protein
VELIVRALEADGRSVGWNHEGSNQTEGVATLLLRLSSLRGKVRGDAIVIECDERYAVRIFEKVLPSVLVVTNLCRDQLTRNGHPEFIQDRIRAAIEVISSHNVTLVLNADDPYVATLAAGDVLWFGLSPAVGTTSHVGMYDDGVFCPVCKGRMSYGYRIAEHYGSYACGNCDHKRSDPEAEVTELDYETGKVTLKSGESAYLALPSLAAAYNLVAAITAAAAAGVSEKTAVQALDNIRLTGGRTVEFSIGERKGILLISKHENSLSYNQSMSLIIGQYKPCAVVILVDTISRKYYTSETSWLWDVDFDLLAADNVRSIVLAGRYVNELAARFAMSPVDSEKIACVTDLGSLHEYLEQNGTEDIYAVTCFADKVKLLKVLI